MSLLAHAVVIQASLSTSTQLKCGTRRNADSNVQRQCQNAAVKNQNGGARRTASAFALKRSQKKAAVILKSGTKTNAVVNARLIRLDCAQVHNALTMRPVNASVSERRKSALEIRDGILKLAHAHVNARTGIAKRHRSSVMSLAVAFVSPENLSLDALRHRLGVIALAAVSVHMKSSARSRLSPTISLASVSATRRPALVNKFSIRRSAIVAAHTLSPSATSTNVMILHAVNVDALTPSQKSAPATPSGMLTVASVCVQTKASSAQERPNSTTISVNAAVPKVQCLQAVNAQEIRNSTTLHAHVVARISLLIVPVSKSLIRRNASADAPRLKTAALINGSTTTHVHANASTFLQKAALEINAGVIRHASASALMERRNAKEIRFSAKRAVVVDATLACLLVAALEISNLIMSHAVASARVARRNAQEIKFLIV